MKTLEQIEKEILKDTTEIRLRGVLKRRKESLPEFLNKFFTDFNNRFETIHVNNGHVQTSEGCRRSFADIYRIITYYYPKTNIKEIKNLLYKDLFEIIPKFRSSNCSQIKKRVWYCGESTQKSALLEKTQQDEFGLTVENWLNL